MRFVSLAKLYQGATMLILQIHLRYDKKASIVHVLFRFFGVN